MSTTARTFARRYEVVREIARGGMAEVFLARDRTLDRPVAVKVLFPELSRDPSFVERFRREAQAAANLSHPNIVAVYDWGEEAGTYFIVMEYVEGQSLREVLRAETRVPADRAAEIGADIAAALAFANKAGVVHRDIKPGNVLITPQGHVKVTDFGIARAGTSEALTQTGSVMGTATYFSPEQAQGHPVDGRSDVYSLGVVLYELLSGEPPFQGDSPVSVAYQHVQQEPPPLGTKVPGLPRDLDAIVAHAMAKDPAQRYQTADDLRADLLRFRRGRPVLAAAPTAVVTEMPTTANPTATRRPPVTAPPASPRRTGRRVWLVVGLLVVLIAALAALAFALTRDGGGALLTVPDVVGQEVTVAEQTLDDEGFEVDIERVPNVEVAEDVVISQDPEPDSRLREGRTVTLVVSEGAGSFPMPDLRGEPFVDAAALLTDEGFTVRRENEPSDDLDEGLVTRTDPPAGNRVERGSEVVVFVSAGPAPVAVPDVSGFEQAAAANALGREGFQTSVQTEPSDSSAQGTVIRTDPPANTPVAPGSVIVMIVSSGPETVEVPGVVDDTQSQATSRLQSAGFQVSVTTVASTPANEGRVIAQNPAGGSQARRGTTVELTVGSGPPTTSSTTTTTT